MTVARLEGTPAADRPEELVAEDQDGQAAAGRGRLAELKADPGRPSLETLLGEIDKLTRLRALGLPQGLFVDAPEKLVGVWRARAASEFPAWLRKHPRPTRLTLLACLCWSRQSEITDGLVELLIALVHKIDARRAARGRRAAGRPQTGPRQGGAAVPARRGRGHRRCAADPPGGR